MFKKYSKHELLQEEIRRYTSKSSLVQTLLRNTFSTLLYTLYIPAPVFLRAEVFCADLMEEFEAHITIKELIGLLYSDFLLFARKTNDLDTIYERLSDWLPKRKIQKTKRKIKIYGIGWMENVEIADEDEEDPHLSDQADNIIEVHVYLKRKAALRGEILLADLEQLYPGHGITLEKILEICICDFIHKYTNGDLKNVMERIVDHMENKK